MLMQVRTHPDGDLEMTFAEGSCEGKQNMGKRVLITYASKYGSTGGVADAIGKELCSKDLASKK